MNTAKKYHDSEGNECSIFQVVRLEPEWAASVIQNYEKTTAQKQKRIEELEGAIEDMGNRYNECTRGVTGKTCKSCECKHKSNI